MCRRRCCCNIIRYVLCWEWCKPVYEDDFDIQAILNWNHDVDKYGAVVDASELSIK